MQQDLKNLISECWRGKISREEIISKIATNKSQQSALVRNIFDDIIVSKNSGEVEYWLTLLLIFEENDEFIDLVHQLILEPWHTQYENIAHNLQRRANVKSIPFIKKAMQNKYKHLESYGTGTRQFINQCGHALRQIGTKEAVDVIYELSNADDPVLKDEMLYRISRIEGRDDYERDHDL
ncbi:hypothetical protein [Ferruginibacter sp. SUN106]|uniref:hypothetical protein n=1 Tax=Ferruginibacter sp. SUN106 TaxID=2978348 RepID=UPI003D36CCCF